jgi:hypothetical protein
MMVSANGPQNVGQIQKPFIFGNLFLSPEEYQRENAWGPSTETGPDRYSN